MSQVTTEVYVHVPPEDVPKSTSALKAGKKAPGKQPSSKIRPRPGTRSLNYMPSEKARRKAAQLETYCHLEKRLPADTTLVVWPYKK